MISKLRLLALILVMVTGILRYGHADEEPILVFAAASLGAP